MGGERPGLAAFYLRSVVRNRRALPRQILRMHPWSFPIRLSRLTTAAGSALLVLMMTAESWEVAANLSAGGDRSLGRGRDPGDECLPPARPATARARRRLLREQRAVRNVGTALAVLLGMTITFLAAFALVLVLGFMLFGDGLLTRWTDAPLIALRTAMAGFAAALGLAIGALGASFERYGRFGTSPTWTPRSDGRRSGHMVPDTAAAPVRADRETSFGSTCCQTGIRCAAGAGEAPAAAGLEAVEDKRSYSWGQGDSVIAGLMCPMPL